LFTQVVGARNLHPEFDDLVNARFIIDSPEAEECGREILNLMCATGCKRLVCRVQWVGMRHEHVKRTIALLGEQVTPMVRRALG
jgi:hypothetical protein